MKGLIHVYTGEGKGKTTACTGAAIRAAGSGMTVYFVQFQKGADSGELNILRKTENIEVNRICTFTKFYFYMNEQEKALYTKEHREAFNSIKDTVKKDPFKYDMLVLDEILGAVKLGIIAEDSLSDFLKTKPAHLEVLLSGRDASENIINIADYVSDIKCVKHPYNNNIAARKGIEY
ncbi:MAG TPA: cob(I)yrinic acid a,c-diamide adenosyltransferase [Clostridia bacterium]|nr:cob(I)yrinic acid a,c-diamide adenosyltransferase [Clostridia bacterium]HQC67867.1 cob(I)yrinic acid a,c-diamide adenosyltransferase [Clostridia bacterium]